MRKLRTLEDENARLKRLLADGSDEPPSSPLGGLSGSSIAVEVGGVRIVVPPDFDEGHLARVLRAVRGAA